MTQDNRDDRCAEEFVSLFADLDDWEQEMTLRILKTLEFAQSVQRQPQCEEKPGAPLDPPAEGVETK